jgi:predicted short-subunit dehydrogenase-like oxidoreductase (DUF2520 family)
MVTDLTALPPGRIAVIGPGRVGTVVAAALTRAGHRVHAAAGGSGEALARFAARFPGAGVGETPAAAAGDADLVLITTPDDAIAAVATALARDDAIGPGQRVVHVAGALGLGPLLPVRLAGAAIAACHPAQTVPSADADPDVLAGAAWAVTAADADLAWARALVAQAGGVAHDVSDGARPLYHAGLAVGSNAAAAAVALARQLLLAAGIGDVAAFLGPLVAASTGNALTHGAAAITGPVARGDVGTLRRHLELLDADLPELAAPYRHLALATLAQVAPALGALRTEEVAAALAPVTTEARR